MKDQPISEGHLDGSTRLRSWEHPSVFPVAALLCTLVALGVTGSTGLSMRTGAPLLLCASTAFASVVRREVPWRSLLALALTLLTVSALPGSGGVLLGTALALVLVARGTGQRASLVGTCWLSVALVLPEAWVDGNWTREVSTVLARMIPGEADGSGVRGPSAIGLPILLVASAFTLASPRGGGRRWLAFSLIVATFLLQSILARFIHSHVGPYADHGHPRELFDQLGFMTAASAVAVSVAWSRGAHAEAVTQGDSDRSHDETLALDRVAFASGAGAAIVIGATIALVRLDFRLGASEEGVVTFLNEGGFDWDVPNLDEVGALHAGMFGLLPHYLKAAGWRTETADVDDLSRLDERSSGVLVVMNCPHRWSAAERGQVREFVRRGGGVLVLGDHTNVFDLMVGSNTLTSEYGIEFVFDSAYHRGASWAGATELNLGLLGSTGFPDELSFSIGSSLDVRWPASVVLSGRYAFGDWGVEDNFQGSFLGNYSHTEDEELGDVPMLAMRRFGRGTVAVCGDTTSFQNGVVTLSFRRFIGPLLRQLNHPAPFPIDSRVSVVLRVIGLGALVLLGTRRRHSARWIVLSAACGIGGVMTAARVPEESLAELTARAPVAVMSMADLPFTGHYKANYNDLSGLERSFVRAGALTLRDASEVFPSDVTPRFIGIVAPRRQISARRAESLIHAVERGACLVLAVSADSVLPAARLLELAGFGSSPHRLGMVPRSGDRDPEFPQFLDAMTLQPLPEWGEPQALCQIGESLLIARRNVGSGSVIVVGDERFFSRENYEDMTDWDAINMRLLQSALAEGATEHAEIEPLFSAPKGGLE